MCPLHAPSFEVEIAQSLKHCLKSAELIKTIHIRNSVGRDDIVAADGLRAVPVGSTVHVRSVSIIGSDDVIGEILDVDALTGGFNLQIALSTAYSCAQGILSE